MEQNMDEIQEGATITESPAVEDDDYGIDSLIEDIKSEKGETEQPKKESGEPEKEVDDNTGIIEDEEEDLDENVLPEGIKKRISKLSGKAKDLEKELEYYKQIAEQAPPAVDVGNDVPTLPDPDMYGEGTFDRQYQEDVHRYYVESAKRELLVSQQKAVEQNKVNQHYNNIRLKVESAISEKPELGKMMNEVTNVSPLFTELVHSSKHLPRLVEYFHANKQRATQISMLSPQDTMREIIKLELAFDSKPTVKTTTAPDPVKKIKTSGSGISKSIMDENITDDELFRMV